MSVTTIGRCKGCDKTRKLDDGACQECLTHPKRGRQWCEFSHRVRIDPEFALETFNGIGLNKPQVKLLGRAKFIRDYGFPKGAEATPDLIAFLRAHPESRAFPKIKEFLDSVGDMPVEESDEPEEPRPLLRLVR
jgi:hypothetical protein